MHWVDDVLSNVLQLLGMVMPACVMFVLGGRRPRRLADHVLLRGDNSSAVTGVNRCRGGKGPRSGALVRMSGVSKIAPEWVSEV